MLPYKHEWYFYGCALLSEFIYIKLKKKSEIIEIISHHLAMKFLCALWKANLEGSTVKKVSRGKMSLKTSAIPACVFGPLPGIACTDLPEILFQETFTLV